MLASPASTTVRDIERAEAGGAVLARQLEAVERPGRVVRLPDGARAEAGAGTVADGVVERRPDDGRVSTARRDLGRVLDPGQLLERDRADVRGQVVALEDFERRIEPAVRSSEVGRAGHGARRVVGHAGISGAGLEG